jgi:hypothetical protein
MSKLNLLRILLVLLALVSSSCAVERRTPTPSVNATPAPTSDSTKLPTTRAPSTATIQRSNEPTTLFTRANIPGFTDIQEGTNGIALADLNRDGLTDIVATYTPPMGLLQRGSDKLRVFINQGNLQFKEHAIKITNQKLAANEYWRSAQVPNLADFNRDGFLDLYITRHAPMNEGVMRRGAIVIGNTLLVSQGAWDTFEDVSEKMGVRNETGYNRQSSIGDVNKDGWLDIAVGCDNIGNAMGGLPYSRLYIFQPKGNRFEDGAFKDIGRTDLVPEFGGFYHDSNKDKAGPGITLRDLDNDGDLDLIQSYHVDVREPLLPYSPGEYAQGIFVWKNLLAETGTFKFQRITDNGLAEYGKLKYNQEKKIYEPVALGPGLPYLSMADVDNDGLLDVLAIGPSDPGWAPRAEYIGGRFYRNQGDFKFQRATTQAGLDALNWTYREWWKFWNLPIPANLQNWRPLNPGYQGQPGMQPISPLDHRFYAADAVVADFNNDGWVDLVYVDRHENQVARYAVLFLNKGNGTFEPTRAEISGIDASGIAAEVADLNNDGLLDLVFAADPDNSGGPYGGDKKRYEDKVFINTGALGGRDNHWLHLRFSGVSDAELIGARVEARDASGKLLGLRVLASNHSYKSGGALDAHFGLGAQMRVNLSVTLLNGKSFSFADVASDRFTEVNLQTRAINPIGK